MMSIPASIREGAKIVGGIILGAVGAVLFQRSLPPPTGTTEAKLFAIEHDLQQAQQRIHTLEDLNPNGTRKMEGGMMDAVRSLAQDLREGKTINPDDIWRATRPLLRDLAPLFDRLRMKDEARQIDWRVGEMGRKYGLTAEQQTALRAFFKDQGAENHRKWQAMLDDPHSTLLDFEKTKRKLRPDAEMDGFMESTLTGDKLTAYKSERLKTRAENVQRDADFKVERLSGIVSLDETQKDEVFAIMARGSKDYDPSMKLEGLGADVSHLPPGESTYQAVQSVLRPEQASQLEADKAQRRTKAEREMGEVGLTLPADWDMLEQGELGW